MGFAAMRAHVRTIGTGVLGLIALVAAAGCGSSASEKAKATTPAPITTDAAASKATTPAGSNGTGSGDVTLPVHDASYNSGRVHVEFGGDSGGSAEIDGQGAIVGGFANLVFSDANRQASVIFGVGAGQPGAASFTWDGITSGGEFGKQCTITFTKGDQTALEGEFSCSGMDGVKTTSTDAVHVDAKGTFTLAVGG